MCTFKHVMVWCWWCCHPVEEEKTIGMPMAHDPIKNTFDTYGHFCSVSCMRSYNQNEPMTKRTNQVALISLYLRKNGINDDGSYAPPRQMLDVFGGSMTITEFRERHGNTTYHLQLPHAVRVNHTIDVKNKSNYKWIKSSNDNNEKTYSMKDFEEHASANKVENNAIKIKPSQATKKKQVNTLEMVLGLVPNSQ